MNFNFCEPLDAAAFLSCIGNLSASFSKTLYFWSSGEYFRACHGPVSPPSESCSQKFLFVRLHRSTACIRTWNIFFSSSKATAPSTSLSIPLSIPTFILAINPLGYSNKQLIRGTLFLSHITVGACCLASRELRPYDGIYVTFKWNSWLKCTSLKACSRKR